MEMLYRTFKEHPYQAVELKQIDMECCVNPKELNWNIVYLEKCGYVELGKSHDSAPCGALCHADGGRNRSD